MRSWSNFFNTQLFSPYSWKELYRVFDSSYYSIATEWITNEMTLTNPVIWDFIELWFSCEYFWLTGGCDTDIQFEWWIITAMELCDIMWFQYNGFTGDNQATDNIVFDSPYDTWLYTWNASSISDLSCLSAWLVEQADTELQINLEYSQYVTQTHILFVLLIFLWFYVINLFISTKFKWRS